MLTSRLAREGLRQVFDLVDYFEVHFKGLRALQRNDLGSIEVLRLLQPMFEGFDFLPPDTVFMLLKILDNA